MEKELFIFADEIADRLCISKAYAYKLMQQMNKELQKKVLLRFMVVSAEHILKSIFMECQASRKGGN